MRDKLIINLATTKSHLNHIYDKSKQQERVFHCSWQ